MQALWQEPVVAPTHVCDVAHCSFALQPQTPALQMPLTQSFPVTQDLGMQEPLHELPDPQSVFDEHALALHIALLHRPPVPQSVLEPHEAGGVQVAPLQVTPAGHWLSLLQVERPHLAPLHRRLTPHAASFKQICLPHVAPLHSLLFEQSVSREQAAGLLHFAPLHCWLFVQSVSTSQAPGVLHFAPVHDWLFEQSVSREQAAGVEHLAPLQTRLTPHNASSPQVFEPHVAPEHKPSKGIVPQAESAVHAPAVQMPRVHLAPLPPQSEFLVQVPAVHFPAVAPVPLPHEPLSQSAALWHVVALPVPQDPTVEPVPVPHELLSQSPFLWHAAPPRTEHVPLLEPVPVPHELLSQSPFLWQTVPAATWHVPLLEPVPVPHELLSQSASLWQPVPPPSEQVPLTALVPVPHVALSQSAFLWHTALLVLHVPVDELLPLPQVPVAPQSPSLWQVAPPAHVPSRPEPPHVPSPQSVLAWQLTELQVPPLHVPAPHCALDVHEMGVQVAPPHTPLPQSALEEHEQIPEMHSRPPPQSQSRVQAADRQTPTVAPAHAKVEFGQSAGVRHGSEHCPMAPGSRLGISGEAAIRIGEALVGVADERVGRNVEIAVHDAPALVRGSRCPGRVEGEEGRVGRKERVPGVGRGHPRLRVRADRGEVLAPLVDRELARRRRGGTFCSHCEKVPPLGKPVLTRPVIGSCVLTVDVMVVPVGVQVATEPSCPARRRSPWPPGIAAKRSRSA